MSTNEAIRRAEHCLRTGQPITATRYMAVALFNLEIGDEEGRS